MATRKKSPTVRSSAIESLRGEVQDYHLEVTKSLATVHANLKHFGEKLESLSLTINGESPENKDAPSLKARVSALESARKHAMNSITIAWTVLTALVGTLGSLLYVFRSTK